MSAATFMLTTYTVLLLSSSSGKQNALKTEIQQEKEKGIYWDKLGKQARNQFGKDESDSDDLDPYKVPNKHWTSDPC